MTVKKNEKEIADLEAKVAELEAKLEAKGDGKVTRTRRKPEEARKEIEAKRGKMKTYRAIRAGTDYREGFIAEGRIFTTDQPKGEWMEEVDAKPERRNQFAVGPDLNARMRDMVEDGDIADEGKAPRTAEDE